MSLKYKLDYEFPKYGYEINNESTRWLSILSITAGALAGMLGIGGGLIINPMLLELGLKPTVVASTTSFTILFTSSMSLAQTILHGDIGIQQIIWFGILSIIGSYLISRYINYLTRKYKRESLILFLITFVVFLAMLVIPSYGVYKVMKFGAELKF